MKGEKFLSKAQLKETVKGWASDAKLFETGSTDGPAYETRRYEGTQSFFSDIAFLHQMSFLRTVIPEMIQKLDGERPVKVLDIGAGAGVFAEQLRQTFGDQIRVFTTGLSKKAAMRSRKHVNPEIVPNITEMPVRLKKDDLKWRSVSQLTDSPEFDLIVDTLGEGYYREGDIAGYADAIVAKLAPGGMASIAGPANGANRTVISPTIEELKEKYGPDVRFEQDVEPLPISSAGNFYRFRIYKGESK